jgi:hypothetical protein
MHERRERRDRDIMQDIGLWLLTFRWSHILISYLVRGAQPFRLAPCQTEGYQNIILVSTINFCLAAHMTFQDLSPNKAHIGSAI